MRGHQSGGRPRGRGRLECRGAGAPGAGAGRGFCARTALRTRAASAGPRYPTAQPTGTDTAPAGQSSRTVRRWPTHGGHGLRHGCAERGSLHSTLGP